MKCPNCHSKDSKVIDSRKRETLYRRRKCQECDTPFTTYEISLEEFFDRLEDEGMDDASLDLISNVLANKPNNTKQVKKKRTIKGNVKKLTMPTQWVNNF